MIIDERQSSNTYVVVVGTCATDECLHDLRQSGVDLVQSTTGTDTTIEGIEIVMNYQIPDIPVFDRVIFYYENGDLEGMLHMKEIHDHEFYLYHSAPSPPPNLYRRLEKRPYSGHCNLRF